MLVFTDDPTENRDWKQIPRQGLPMVYLLSTSSVVVLNTTKHPFNGEIGKSQLNVFKNELYTLTILNILPVA